MAYLSNQFNHVFALLSSTQSIKSNNFYLIRPKIKLFLQKKTQNF